MTRPQLRLVDPRETEVSQKRLEQYSQLWQTFPWYYKAWSFVYHLPFRGALWLSDWLRAWAKQWVEKRLPPNR